MRGERKGEREDNEGGVKDRQKEVNEKEEASGGRKRKTAAWKEGDMGGEGAAQRRAKPQKKEKVKLSRRKREVGEKKGNEGKAGGRDREEAWSDCCKRIMLGCYTGTHLQGQKSSF